MQKPNQKLEKGSIFILSIGFVIWSAVFISQTSVIAFDGHRYFCLFDDAMISMRYAWNFSHGSGLVWNHGEYIQGYSNLLLTLLMSSATYFLNKSTAALFMQIAGAAFMLAIATISMKISDLAIPTNNYPSRAIIRILSFLGGLCYYPLAYWSLMGMETGLLTLLLLLSILCALNYSKSGRFSTSIAAAIFLGLAYLTRIDAVIFAIPTFIYILFVNSRQLKNRNVLLRLSAIIGFYLLFVAGLLIFQYLYYGDLLPNTYYLKLTGMPFLNRMNDGIDFIIPFLNETWIVLIISMLGIFIHLRKQSFLLFSLVLAAIGYQIYIGGDAWNYWRIMSPTIPLEFILFISAINAFIQAIMDSKVINRAFPAHFMNSKKVLAASLVIILSLSGFLYSNNRFKDEIFFSSLPFDVSRNIIRINTAIFINKFTSKEATIGVFAAGAIPYYTDRRGIDFLGKADKYIAHLPPHTSGVIAKIPGHNKFDLNYSIKTLQPTFVERMKWGGEDLSQWAQTRYAIIQYHDINLFLLKDSPLVFWKKIANSVTSH